MTEPGGWMLCPACGQNHSRIVGAGNDSPTTGTPYSFVAAFIEFEGDCGHRWEIVTRYSKGQVSLEVNVTGYP